MVMLTKIPQIFTFEGTNEQFKESSRFSDIWNLKWASNASEHCLDLVNHMWAGEIAEHNGGGAVGTNTFWDGFWYLDALGSLAVLGTETFARQTLARSGYGLIGLSFPFFFLFLSF